MFYMSISVLSRRELIFREVFYQAPGGCFNDFCFYPDPADYDSI